jgi:hypothetical protein
MTPTDPTTEHIVIHIRDALATDGRVGELGLDVSHERVAGIDTIVVRGAVSTDERKAAVATVVVEVLQANGLDCAVRDETDVPHATPPEIEAEPV